MVIKIYRPMVPPFELKSFREMNKKEAQQYFDWFIWEIPNRIEQLADTFEILGGGSKEALDFTPESLKPLWEWFIPKVKLVPKTEEEMEQSVQGAPDWLKERLMEHKDKLSNMTLSMSMDIGIYFAETFVKNNDGIKWGFNTTRKRWAYVNRPVLVGFRFKNIALPPVDVLHTLTLKASTGESTPDALYNLYYVWKEDV